MTRLWLIRVALVLAQAIPGALNAKTITVQSGEHAGFTRLVVYYKGTTGWSFGATDGGFALRPEKPGMTYDLDRVYQLIPRDRIADISARPDGTLFLSVVCACHAEVSEHLGQVVVDVKDGAETSAVDGNGSAVYASAVPGVAYSKPKPGSEAFQGPPPSYRSRGSGLVWNDLDLSRPLLVKSPLAGSDMTPRMQVPDPRIAETRSALITQIARAASDGLITPDLTVLDANVSVPAQTPVEPDPAPVPVEEAALPAGPNIRIETAFERSELSTDPPTARNESGENCLASSRFDLSAWGRPPEQGAAIASYRAGLVGEFDAANPESLAALATLYLPDFRCRGARPDPVLRWPDQGCTAA